MSFLTSLFMALTLQAAGDPAAAEPTALDHLSVFEGDWSGVEWNGDIVFYRFQRLDEDTIHVSMSGYEDFSRLYGEMFITREGDHVVVRHDQRMWRSLSVTQRFAEFEPVRSSFALSWRYEPGRIVMLRVPSNPDLTQELVLRPD